MNGKSTTSSSVAFGNRSSESKALPVFTVRAGTREARVCVCVCAKVVWELSKHCCVWVQEEDGREMMDKEEDTEGCGRRGRMTKACKRVKRKNGKRRKERCKVKRVGCDEYCCTSKRIRCVMAVCLFVLLKLWYPCSLV